MNKFLEYRYLIVVLIILGGAFYIAGAFTSPTQAPPNGNVSAPLDTSATAQTKQGNLQVNGNVTVQSPGSVNATQLCIGGVCKSAWPPELRPTDIGAASSGWISSGRMIVCSNAPCGCEGRGAGCNWWAANDVVYTQDFNEDARGILSVVYGGPRTCYTGWRNRDGSCQQDTWNTNVSYQCAAPWSTTTGQVSEGLRQYSTLSRCFGGCSGSAIAAECKQL